MTGLYALGLLLIYAAGLISGESLHARPMRYWTMAVVSGILGGIGLLLVVGVAWSMR